MLMQVRVVLAITLQSMQPFCCIVCMHAFQQLSCRTTIDKSMKQMLCSTLHETRSRQLPSRLEQC